MACPRETLPLCLNVKLRRLCSAYRETIYPPVNSCRKEEIGASPGGSAVESTCQVRRHRFDPWIWKDPNVGSS